MEQKRSQTHQNASDASSLVLEDRHGAVLLELMLVAGRVVGGVGQLGEQGEASRVTARAHVQVLGKRRGSAFYQG